MRVEWGLSGGRVGVEWGLSGVGTGGLSGGEWRLGPKWHYTQTESSINVANHADNKKCGTNTTR